ncbi:chymotrypsin inhibitor-like [Lucilia sericata]|uniref:chymotrypsin inhibitor-like n=1 Tax=Lucilia sericata TaxID=13632 RepID=UPI0018A87D92|nr:chymotrypsin inhibitor-like [Lucilia sericata]
MAKLFQNIFLVFGIVLALVAASQAEECEGANQEFNDCGIACPPTCDEPGPKPCTLQCVPGCHCQDGYVLNESDECVLPEAC